MSLLSNFFLAFTHVNRRRQACRAEIFRRALFFLLCVNFFNLNWSFVLKRLSPALLGSWVLIAHCVCLIVVTRSLALIILMIIMMWILSYLGMKKLSVPNDRAFELLLELSEDFIEFLFGPEMVFELSSGGPINLLGSIIEFGDLA